MRFKISFFAVMLLLSLFLSARLMGLVPLIAAATHEFGHILAAKLCGVRLGKMDVGIFGARLSISGGIHSYGKEILVCAAGPFINLLCAYIAAVFLCVSHFENDAVYLFILSSLCLAALNLLPIRTFDGGRIVTALLSKFFDTRVADTSVKILSFFSLFALWCISLYLILRTSASLSLFIFSLSVFANIFIQDK